jgi:hypothetical protein
VSQTGQNQAVRQRGREKVMRNHGLWTGRWSNFLIRLFCHNLQSRFSPQTSSSLLGGVNRI